MRSVFAVLTPVLLAYGVANLGDALNEVQKLPTLPASESDVRPLPRAVRQMLAFGYRNSLADYEWLNAIQYFGQPKNEAEHYKRLYSILDTTTDLDPRFEYAYQFGGESIPYNDAMAKGWFNTRKAIVLLRKGLAERPTRWEIPWLLGYTLYTYWGEYQKAGEAMLEAADLGDRNGRRADARFDAPVYLRSLALRLLAQGGDVDTAIDSTHIAIGTALDETRRAELTERLKALYLQKELDVLNHLVGESHKSLEAALEQAAFGKTDPYDGPFSIDTSGRVRSPNEDKLLRIHVHPGSPPMEHAFD